jgi:glutamyl/glutaminyl-tRNA synthetase
MAPADRLELSSLRRLGRPLTTRFAPSPTGYLHLGHVVNAIYVWGVARVVGGRVLLRIEDHDRTRCRPEFEHQLFTDLAWLGFHADIQPPVRQSERQAVYAAALARLRALHHVYLCTCSRTDIGSERYTGRCRSRGLAESAGRGLRVHIEPGAEHFHDLRHGQITQEPSEQCGDLLIRDRDGQWTYQFAVTVDDADQEVDVVIRGDDLLSSTGRQLRLGRMLGRHDTPCYLHHPLILRSSGKKLSKAAGDTGVRELRAAGMSAADVIGRAAAAVGLLDAAQPIDASRVGELFR